jgi:hypothetical protein
LCFEHSYQDHYGCKVNIRTYSITKDSGCLLSPEDQHVVSLSSKGFQFSRIPKLQQQENKTIVCHLSLKKWTVGNNAAKLSQNIYRSHFLVRKALVQMNDFR